MAAVRIGRHAALSLVAVAALVGCGGRHTSAKPAPQKNSVHAPSYKDELNATLVRLGSTMVKQTQAISRSPTPHLALIHINRLAAQLRTAANELATMQAPAPVRVPHAQLIHGLRKLAAELPSLNKPRRGTIRPSSSFATAIATAPALATIRHALESLRHRGYITANGTTARGP